MYLRDMLIIAYFPEQRKEENKMNEKTIDTLELEDNISEIEGTVNKIRFMLSELDMYDYDYEVTPYKAIQYAKNENDSADCELSFKYCTDHKRIMNIYNIMRDYVYEVEQKLAQVQNSIK